MRFKRNIIPLGSSDILSVRQENDRVCFYCKSNGVIVRKEFDLASHRLWTDSVITAYGGAYLKIKSGAIVDLGELLYVQN